MEFLCTLVPHFRAALAQRDTPGLRGRPVIVGQATWGRGNVVDCSREAMDAGVVPGMPIMRAMALCPAASVLPMRQEQIEQEDRAFRAAAASLFPAIEGIEPGHIHADIGGMARLMRFSPEEYLADLRAALADMTGLPVRAGSAATVFAAHAAAGFLAAPTCHVPGERTTELLAPLPVEALMVSDEMLRRLHLLGLERLEQVGALAATALQAQFGPEGMQAWRLIHGRERGSITPEREELCVEERMELGAAAVFSAPLVLATQILLQRALRRPEIGGRALRRADWVAVLENEERMAQRFVFREPTSDPERMLFVLRGAVERLALDAPVVGVELKLSGICSEYAWQERMWQTGPRQRRALGSAIEQLAVRSGGPQVYRIVEVEPWSRIPERQRALAAYSP